MSRFLQTASAVLLLVLVPILGQAEILQCLCSGQFSSSAFAVEGTEACCCEKESACDECPHDDEQPAPCDDGSCWVVITIDAVETTAVQLPGAPEAPISLPAFAVPALSTLPVAANHPFFGKIPPDRHAAPLTVLFSSFLI